MTSPNKAELSQRYAVPHSPAGRKKMAHRFIGGCRRRAVESPVRDQRTLPSLTGLIASSFPVPTDKSVGHFLSPCRAETTPRALTSSLSKSAVVLFSRYGRPEVYEQRSCTRACTDVMIIIVSHVHYARCRPSFSFVWLYGADGPSPHISHADRNERERVSFGRRMTG